MQRSGRKWQCSSNMHFIEVFVNRLRSKLGRELIATRRGQGYVLVTGAGSGG